jgi:cephalosporin hydroxylase
MRWQYNKPLQDVNEFAAFIKVVRRENIRSYLEIGSFWGGSFWGVMTSLPKGSWGVAIDAEPKKDLEECMKHLLMLGYDVSLIKGNSTDSKVINQAALSSPYDLCFIDADHTEHFVRQDWKNYGPMARVVAFHDIGHFLRYPTADAKLPVDVPRVWDEIKADYRHEEIKLYRKNGYGIGVLWRH